MSSIILDPATPGDQYLQREIVRHIGHLGGEVTEGDMARLLGPNWRGVRALVRRTATMTSAELDAAWAAGVARDAAWHAAWYAVWDAAAHATRITAWAAARGATRITAWYAVWDAVVAAGAAGAAGAAVVADLAKPNGPLTREHLAALASPWCEATGTPLADVIGEDWQAASLLRLAAEDAS